MNVSKGTIMHVDLFNILIIIIILSHIINSNKSNCTYSVPTTSFILIQSKTQNYPPYSTF